LHPAFRKNFSLEKNRLLFFPGSKNRAALMIPQQDSAVRAFNKLARTFAAQVETLTRYRGGGEQTMPAALRRLAVGVCAPE
jgi:hypothetical protein